MRALLLLLFIFSSHQSFGQLQELRREILKIIRFDTDISRSDTKGFIIGVVDQDSTYIIPFQSPDTTLPVLDDQSYFEIGGLTKVFTAHLLAALQHSGHLTLDTSINTLLPVEYQNVNQEISLNDLLTHASGMPKTPSGFGLTQDDPRNPYAGFSNNHALRYYSQLAVDPSSRKFLYSHFNYALIQAVIETYLGKSITQLIDAWVLQESSLDNTSFESNTSLEPGYTSNQIPSYPWTFDSYNASLGLKSTLSDLLRYVKLHLDHHLDPELYQSLHQIHAPTDLAKNLFIGKGWYIFNSRKTYPIYTHAGHTGGHKAFMGFVKETQTGVVILARSRFEVEDLGLLILRLINNNWKRK